MRDRKKQKACKKNPDIRELYSQESDLITEIGKCQQSIASLNLETYQTSDGEEVSFSNYKDVVNDMIEERLDRRDFFGKDDLTPYRAVEAIRTKERILFTHELKARLYRKQADEKEIRHLRKRLEDVKSRIKDAEKAS